MIGSVLSRVLTGALILFVAGFTVGAQDLDDVTMSGQVKDGTGLAIVGATVVALAVDTGLERSVVTDDDGRYRILKYGLVHTRSKSRKQVLAPRRRRP